jgi:hypothetical protein
MKLAEFNMEISHRAGSKLVNADCISCHMMDLINSISDVSEGTPAFVKAQQEDKFLGPIYEKVQKIELQETSMDVELSGNKLVVENKAFYWVNRNSPKWQKFWVNDDQTLQQTLIVDGVETTRVCIPEKFVPDILQAYHEEGHWCYQSVIKRLQKVFYWRKMYKDTTIFCKMCDTCQKCNKGKKFIGQMSYLEVTARNQVLGIDTYSGLPTSPYGNNKILVLTDYLTHFCWLVPVSDTKAETVAQALISTWLGVFGPSDSIIFNQGHDNKEFGNEFLQAVYESQKCPQ